MCTNFQFIDFNSFYKIYLLSIFPYKGIREQSWSCCEAGQGQHMIIIWTNFKGPMSLMLYTKFKGHRLVGFGKDFWRVFTIYGHGGHLGHMTRIIWTNFHSPIPLRLHINFGFDWRVISEEMFKNGGHGDGRTTEACLYYKLTHEPKGSGELIMTL